MKSPLLGVPQLLQSHLLWVCPIQVDAYFWLAGSCLQPFKERQAGATWPMQVDTDD